MKSIAFKEDRLNELSGKLNKTKTRPLFCEISEFYENPDTHEKVWKESARLLKFIEVTEDSGKWSKPHVATIPLSSLVELRAQITRGVVMLNHNANNLDSLFGKTK
jgi:hypothetical protein